MLPFSVMFLAKRSCLRNFLLSVVVSLKKTFAQSKLFFHHFPMTTSNLVEEITTIGMASWIFQILKWERLSIVRL